MTDNVVRAGATADGRLGPLDPDGTAVGAGGDLLSGDGCVEDTSCPGLTS